MTDPRAEWKSMSAEQKHAYRDKNNRLSYQMFAAAVRRSGGTPVVATPPSQRPTPKTPSTKKKAPAKKRRMSTPPTRNKTPKTPPTAPPKTPPTAPPTQHVDALAAKCLPDDFVFETLGQADAACSDLTTDRKARAYRHRIRRRVCCKSVEGEETMRQARLRTLRLARALIPESLLAKFLGRLKNVPAMMTKGARGTAKLAAGALRSFSEVMDAAVKTVREIGGLAAKTAPFVFVILVLFGVHRIGVDAVVPSLQELNHAMETYQNNRILEFIELILRVGVNLLPASHAGRAQAVLASIPHGDVLLKSIAYYVTRLAQSLPGISDGAHGGPTLPMLA